MRKQTYNVRQGKNLAFKRKYMCRKEKSAVTVNSRKSENCIEAEREFNRKRQGWRLTWFGPTEKKAFDLLRWRKDISDQTSDTVELLLLVWPPQ